MRTLAKVFAILSLAVIPIAACNKTADEEPVKIRLNKELITDLPVGSAQTLVATLSPADAKVTVVWASDDEKVAVVNEEGLVTGVAPGTAVISATVDKEVATCKVTVTAVKPEKISLNPDKLELHVDDQHALEVVLVPSNAVAEDLEWASTDPSVASVDKTGLVKALKEGQAVITVKCGGGMLAATCQVKVIAKEEVVEVASIALEPASLSLEEGRKSRLNVVVTPENAVVDDLEWETSDAEVAAVADGEVTALKAGKATITAKCNGGSLSAKCDITVTEKAPAPGTDPVKSVMIFAEGDVSDLQVGKPLQLTAVYEPATAVPEAVSWTVDRTDLAQVDQNGVATGVMTVKESDGSWPKVNVTVTADGVSSSLSLRVIPRQPDAIEVDRPANNELRVGEGWMFNPRIVPEGLDFSVACYGDFLDAFGTFRSGTPGLKHIDFYVSNHDDLVYGYMRESVHINVIPYWVETISLPETYEIDCGSSTVLVPVFTSDVDGVQPTYKNVKWSSSDPAVATVDAITGEVNAIAEGETVITVTTDHEWSVPAGTSAKSATCTLVVRKSESGLNVGDYYYSDGTWSTELQEDKTVIGVVFAKVDATSSDPLLKEAYPGCTHGLVVSIAEYADQDFGSVSTYHGHEYYAGLGYDADMIVDTDKPNGYGNTLAHRDLNASKSDYCLFFNAADGVVARHSAAVSAPESASAWYIPSFKEMQMINDNREAVNAAVNAVGGDAVAECYEGDEMHDENRAADWYWTSTIYGEWYAKGGTYDHSKYAFDLSRNGWTKYVQAYTKCKVRVVLAF